MTAFAQPDLAAPPPTRHPLGDEMVRVVKEQATLAPRSLQVAVGPSEVGMPCQRRLAYRLLNYPTANVDADPWAAVIGTATHTWLADALRADNQRRGRTRWAIETPLEIAPGLRGSCDAFDLDTLTPIDHKIVGTTTMQTVKRDGPSQQYRTQLQLYGLGWDNLGFTPTEVVIVFYPRGGYLGGVYAWPEPYDRAAALAALERLDWLRIALDLLDIDQHLDNLGQITAAPGHACAWCPWFAPGARSFAQGCRGHLRDGRL